MLTFFLFSVLLNTVHFMHFALAAYGWPMYVFHNKTQSIGSSLCHLCCCPPTQCCCCSSGFSEEDMVLEDNICNCNLAAMNQVWRTKFSILNGRQHFNNAMARFKIVNKDVYFSFKVTRPNISCVIILFIYFYYLRMHLPSNI